MTKTMIDGIYELILRTPDGRERRQLALVPNDRVRQDYINKARKNGLEIELKEINE
ncbi:MAG: hypothetical protein IJ588_01150 [Prevotella sp.]|nr:hypothetical protein [Prevotella sp.]